MTKEDTQNGNFLIANFMGYKYEEGLGKDHCGWYKIVYSTFDTEKELGHREYLCRNDSMMYHKSWKWLMLVVEKIEKTGCIVEMTFCLGMTCKIQKGDFKNGTKYFLATETNDMKESVFLSVVEYIKWYNEQNKENEIGKI